MKVSFPGRETRMGAYTQYYMFSLKTRRAIEPHHTIYSKTGRHWTDVCYLAPGRYFVAWIDISNSGKHYCGYGALVVNSDGKYSVQEWEGGLPVPRERLRNLCDICFG